MATKKVYDSDEILKMSVGLVEPDVETDKSVKNNASSVGNAGASMNSASDDWFKKSNAYQKQADTIYEQIQATPDFKYDFNEDAVFQALKEQYIKDGKLAAENVAGQAAALSGGYGNSYGTIAAGLAYMGAIDNLYDVIPELQESAYAKYQNEKADALTNWQILQNRADTERAYAQNERAYQDSKAALSWEQALQKAELGDYSGLKELGVDTSRSEYALNLSEALKLAELGDYSGLKALGIDTSNSEYESKLSKALALAEVGDYSGLKALGVDTSNSEYELNFNKALALAELGDYSGLKALGIDTSNSEYESKLSKALALAEVGDYSGLKALGVDTSSSEYTSKLNEALTLAEIGDYSGLKALGVDTSRSEYALNLNNALALAELRDYSALKALGVDVSSVEKQNTLDFALAAAEVGDYSFLKALGIDTSALEKPVYSYVSGSGKGDNSDNSGDVKADEKTLKRKKEYQTEIERLQRIIDNSELYGAAISGDAGKKLKQLEEAYRKEFGETI